MIWLIGGTQESRAIAHLLDGAAYPWVVTVTTPTATRLYQGCKGSLWVGCLDTQSLDKFLLQYSIQWIVDASHPFATQISQLAIQAAQHHQLPYLRFERPYLPVNSQVEVVPDWPALLQDDYLCHRRILLTVGVKALPYFLPWLIASQFWARILPSSLGQAMAMGFSREQLIPLRLPLTLTQEIDLWRDLAVDTVITKSSGESGGLAIKQAAATQLGVRLLVVERPPLLYPQQTSKFDTVLAFCRDPFSFT
ncbi:MAG: cobalt-precorrin-6A reductase [Cyanobacteriota bacterium]|nr:cobalt-precorrin-6A reductase [Cyanobacteriota bacterium]